MSSQNGTRATTRPDDFIREALATAGLRVNVPDPETDFRMYEQMDEAFDGLHGYLDDLRRNQGRLAYTAQNSMSDLTKEYIDAVQRGGGEEEELVYLERAMEQLALGFDEAADQGEIADNSNRFSRTMWQEMQEAVLVGRIWPVIVGEANAIPRLTPWGDFEGNVQAFLYGYLDAVPELGKMVTEELSRSDMTTEQELAIFERYLAVADSITLRLSQERHVPGYVISNGYGRWMSYATKLRTAYGTIGHVRRDYNLRRSVQRMVSEALAKR